MSAFAFDVYSSWAIDSVTRIEMLNCSNNSTGWRMKQHNWKPNVSSNVSTEKHIARLTQGIAQDVLLGFKNSVQCEDSGDENIGITHLNAR